MNKKSIFLLILLFGLFLYPFTTTANMWDLTSTYKVGDFFLCPVKNILGIGHNNESKTFISKIAKVSGSDEEIYELQFSIALLDDKLFDGRMGNFEIKGKLPVIIPFTYLVKVGDALRFYEFSSWPFNSECEWSKCYKVVITEIKNNEVKFEFKNVLTRSDYKDIEKEEHGTAINDLGGYDYIVSKGKTPEEKALEAYEKGLNDLGNLGADLGDLSGALNDLGSSYSDALGDLGSAYSDALGAAGSAYSDALKSAGSDYSKAMNDAASIFKEFY